MGEVEGQGPREMKAPAAKPEGDIMKLESLPPPPVDVYTKWRAEVETAAARCGPRDLLNVPALIEAVIPGGAGALLAAERYGGVLVIYAYLYARDVDGLTSHVNLAAVLTLEAAVFAGDVLMPGESFTAAWGAERAAGRDSRGAVNALAVKYYVPFAAVAARAVGLGLVREMPRDRRNVKGPPRRRNNVRR